MSIVLYFVVAGAALLAASKLLRPISLRDAAVLALLPLATTGGALASGRVWAPVDLAWSREPLASLSRSAGVTVESADLFHDVWSQMIPWHAAVRRALAAGEAPLWNPFVLGGEPLLASYQPGLLHPVRALALLLPLPQAITWMAAMTLLLAALSMYLLARELGTKGGAALLAAAAWSFGAFLGQWLHWAHGLTAAAVPLALAAAIRVARDPGPRAAVALALASALVLLGGSPETALVAGLMVAAAVAGATLRPRCPRRGAVLGWAAAAGLLALALAAAQLAPFLEALPQTAEWSLRQGRGHPGASAGGAALARGGAKAGRAAIAVPQAGERGKARIEPVRASAWIGGWALMVGGLGAVRARSRWRWYFLACCAIGAAFALSVPIVARAADALPLLSMVVPRYGWVAASIGSCALFALGCDIALERPGERATRVLLLAGCAALALGVAAGLGARGGAPASGARGATIVVGALLAALVVGFVRGRERRLGALLALLVLERAGLDGHPHRSYPEAAFYPEPAAVARLREGIGFGRVVALGNVLYPNLSAIWGLEDVRGYDPMQLRRFAETQPEWSWAKGSSSQFTRVNRLTPMLSYLGVRRAMVTKEVAAAGWRPEATLGRIRILRNRRALPRAFAPALVFADDGSAGWRDLLRDGEELRRTAWLEAAGAVPAGTPAANGPCRVRQLEGGFRFRFRLACERESWIATSIPAWQGWRARAESGELPLGIANHAFVAFRAPAGRAVVDLAYRPWTFGAGLALSTLGVVGAAALLRRPPPGPAAARR